MENVKMGNFKALFKSSLSQLIVLTFRLLQEDVTEQSRTSPRVAKNRNHVVHSTYSPPPPPRIKKHSSLWFQCQVAYDWPIIDSRPFYLKAALIRPKSAFPNKRNLWKAHVTTTSDLLSSVLMVFQQKPNSRVSVTIFPFVMRACELSSLATGRLFISLLHLPGIRRTHRCVMLVD